MKKINSVCIVEDDPIHLYITKKNIELHDLVEEVLVFKNGKEAYYSLKEMFLKNEMMPEVILLDLNMPVWDGWEFLKEFTQLPIKYPVSIYILSSSNNEEDMERAKQYNLVREYYVKPIKSDQIKEILTNATL